MIDRKYLDAHPNPNVHITYGGKLRSGHGVLRRDSEGWYPNIAAAGGSVHRRSRRTRRGGSFRLP